MANLTLKVLQEQINELRNEVAILKATKKINKLPAVLGIGDTFELAGLTWKILDITDKGYMCLADRLEENMEFDEESNDWIKSQLRGYLHTEFIKKITDEVGEDNIISFNRNLLSLDGQAEYGECEDKISLLTVDEYRKYRSLIPNTENYWWWLVTPWSTSYNDYQTPVAVVASSGYICGNLCSGDGGVRPVCIFSSSIFESKE